MFKDIAKNEQMLQGTYRKLKSYYYYNKNFIVMRDKIADFENDAKVMDRTFASFALHLSRPNSNASQTYFNELYAKIDFYALPKKFEAPYCEKTGRPVSNTVARDKQMKTVNFFIDMPIELHLIDTLWTLFVGKISEDDKLISDDAYGNTLLTDVVSNRNNQDGINFSNNRLFNIYFYQYSAWRNNAFKKLEDNYERHKDSVLISLDLQGYFYSIRFSFDALKNLCQSKVLLRKINPLTRVMESVFHKYKEIITPYRKDLSSHSDKEYPLPIGLFSSMVIGNIYLKDFDRQVRNSENLSYYGRYVDDLLFVYKKSVAPHKSNDDIIAEILVAQGLFSIDKNNYMVESLPNLKVQKTKVKIIYLDHSESRALIDIYNNTIKIIPSQANPLPDFDLKISSFDENAYSIEHFTKEAKLRDIGSVNIDSYKVSRFFSSLIMKYSHIDSFNYSEPELEKSISENIKQIEEFFTGSQCLEYYSNWMNYMYFLVITQRWKVLKAFYTKASGIIGRFNITLDKEIFRNTHRKINSKAKEFLFKHLETCLITALSLDLYMVNGHFATRKIAVQKYINANMFNHALVAFPLANYLKYEDDVSYIKMDVKDIGKSFKLDDNIKFKWSPRFIHYDELLMLLFYHNHKEKQGRSNNNYVKEAIVEKFIKVNHLNYGGNAPFEIGYQREQEIRFPNNDDFRYILREIQVPLEAQFYPQKVNIAVANIKLEESVVKSDKNKMRNRWKNITLSYKAMLQGILRETHKYNKPQDWRTPKVLVFPELSIPIYWVDDIVRFAKRTQTAVVAGLQYIYDDSGRAYNYVLTIFPFECGKRKYKNAFVYIREKNDYSPIEKIGLAKTKNFCVDTNIADYQVFSWNGINISAFVCYEFTDIFARALLKGKCDIIAAPVFNQDTTYFSNIIDTVVRDLHAFVVQSNTSKFGDSRVTGPYDRDSKDIFKIKGGENDNIIVGTIDFSKYTAYQSSYYPRLKRKVEQVKPSSNKADKKRTKPNIKPLSARYYNHRANKD